ncbi:hypothetical protein [Nocardiopsis sp. CNT312]|uniref:hypothetical protein n=1 Tax=Nocardiopsis sp. CNT312 TaxID=1137268 RepID=UPI000491A2B4|nr:hypothetical protein [Nocardiopsis sp. CNT312]
MLTRSSLTAALVGVLLPFVLAVPPAAADGHVICSDTKGECIIVAEDGDSEAGNDSPTTDETDAEDEPACEIVDSGTATCSVTVGGGGGTSPVQVAAQAIEMLPLPVPEIGLAPDPSTTALAGMPVWLWVENQTWTTVSRTATAGSISVTATATPDRVEWDMGDGSSVTCYNAGRPYTSGASSSCTHTYESPSRSGPYTITATVYWRITWAGSGVSGGQTLSQTSTATLPVSEAQALVQ